MIWNDLADLKSRKSKKSAVSPLVWPVKSVSVSQWRQYISVTVCRYLRWAQCQYIGVISESSVSVSALSVNFSVGDVGDQYINTGTSLAHMIVSHEYIKVSRADVNEVVFQRQCYSSIQVGNVNSSISSTSMMMFFQFQLILSSIFWLEKGTDEWIPAWIVQRPTNSWHDSNKNAMHSYASTTLITQMLRSTPFCRVLSLAVTDKENNLDHLLLLRRSNAIYFGQAMNAVKLYPSFFRWTVKSAYWFLSTMIDQVEYSLSLPDWETFDSIRLGDVGWRRQDCSWQSNCKFLFVNTSAFLFSWK